MINLKNFSPDKYKFGADASQTIANLGLLNIQSLTVFRRPLRQAVMTLLNTFTFGATDKKLKTSPYDTLFHLGCYVVLENGSLIEIDKQQTLKIRPSKIDNSNGVELLDIPIRKSISLIELIQNTLSLMGKSKFFSYDAKNNNCQDFMIALLQANGLLTSHSADFIKQDVEFIFKNNPSFEKFLKFNTDMIGMIDRNFLGGNITLHSNVTTNVDLQRLAYALGFDVEILSKDEPHKINHDGYYIINLDDKTGLGTHWTGLVIDGTKAFYCDSFGTYPSELISQFLMTHYTVYYNDRQYQHNDSDACGMFTIGFLAFMNSNKNSIAKFNALFVKQFNTKNLKKNDDIIIKYLRQKL